MYPIFMLKMNQHNISRYLKKRLFKFADIRYLTGRDIRLKRHSQILIDLVWHIHNKTAST